MSWLLTAGLIAASVWAVLLFTDNLLRSCQNYPYVWLLNRLGIHLSFGQIKWTTTRCNRLFLWLGSRWPRFFHLWFNAGAVLGVLLLVPSVVVLIITIVDNVSLSDGEHEGEQLLSTMLPGVNLPTGHFPYYLTTFVFSIVFHELGHALAAVREEVRIHGCGLIVIGVLPAAFVDIATDQLAIGHPWKQLKVFCAGIWHNFVLVVVALIALIVLPWVLTIGYSTGNGVAVRHIQEFKSLQHLSSGLSVGDRVIAINDCQVTGFHSWYNCLYQATSAPQSGFCVDEVQLETYKWNETGLTAATETVYCCPADDPRGVCFALLNPSTTTQKFKSFSCLPARKLLKVHSGICFSEEECEPGSSCVVPALENTTRLIQVSRADRDDALYVCQVSELYYSVSVSDYVPRMSFIPVNLPYGIEMFLKYLVSFSGALGLLNAVPCYALDGQWIAMALVEFGLSKVVRNRHTRVVIYRALVAFGTFLLVATIITGIKRIT